MTKLNNNEPVINRYLSEAVFKKFQNDLKELFSTIRKEELYVLVKL